MSGDTPRALSEWLQLMLAEIAAKRADRECARCEAAGATPRAPRAAARAAACDTRGAGRTDAHALSQLLS